MEYLTAWPAAPEVRTECGYAENEFLRADEVGAYLVRFEDDGDSVVEELAVTEEDGIPADEFVRIAEELYDETAALDRVRERR